MDSAETSPEKTITPIAPMTNNSSSVTGRMVLSLFISFTFHDLRETGFSSSRPVTMSL
jgi:hypothetical protein